MRKLPITFEGKGEVSGQLFEQISASDKGFMYKRTDTASGAVGYEVFKRRESKENTVIMGDREVFYQATEVYPKSKDFGVWAWYFSAEQRATERFNHL